MKQKNVLGYITNATFLQRAKKVRSSAQLKLMRHVHANLHSLFSSLFLFHVGSISFFFFPVFLALYTTRLMNGLRNDDDRHL